MHLCLEMQASNHTVDCVPFALQDAQLPRCPAAAQLAVLDQLLWHKSSKSSSSATGTSGNASSGSSGTFKGWLSQLMLKFTLGRLDVQLQDCRCQFVVPWQLGPQSQLPEQQALQQFDGVALSIRLLTVVPHSSRAGSSTAAASSGNVQGASLHEAVGKAPEPSLDKECSSLIVFPSMFCHHCKPPSQINGPV
jgi:hypothetical protein